MSVENSSFAFANFRAARLQPNKQSNNKYIKTRYRNLCGKVFSRSHKLTRLPFMCFIVKTCLWLPMLSIWRYNLGIPTVHYNCRYNTQIFNHLGDSDRKNADWFVKNMKEDLLTTARFDNRGFSSSMTALTFQGLTPKTLRSRHSLLFSLVGNVLIPHQTYPGMCAFTVKPWWTWLTLTCGAS